VEGIMSRQIIKYLILISCIFAFYLNIAGCTDDSRTYSHITEQDIQEIMDNVEEALINNEIDEVIKYMSPSVEINISRDTPLGPRTERWTRDKYMAETETALDMVSNYEYRRDNEVIRISDDMLSAVVETDIFESMNIFGNRIKTTTHELVVMEIIDGNLLVTKMDAEVKGP
jgi:hypothetical protein